MMSPFGSEIFKFYRDNHPNRTHINHESVARINQQIEGFVGKIARLIKSINATTNTSSIVLTFPTQSFSGTVYGKHKI